MRQDDPNQAPTPDSIRRVAIDIMAGGYHERDRGLRAAGFDVAVCLEASEREAEEEVACWEQRGASRIDVAYRLHCDAVAVGERMKASHDEGWVRVDDLEGAIIDAWHAIHDETNPAMPDATTAAECLGLEIVRLRSILAMSVAGDADRALAVGSILEHTEEP